MTSTLSEQWTDRLDTLCLGIVPAQIRLVRCLCRRRMDMSPVTQKRKMLSRKVAQPRPSSFFVPWPDHQLSTRGGWGWSMCPLKCRHSKPRSCLAYLSLSSWLGKSFRLTILAWRLSFNTWHMGGQHYLQRSQHPVPLFASTAYWVRDSPSAPQLAPS